MNEHDEIKVGFITSDFREHPIGFQTLSILKELKNFKKIKIYSFYNNNTEDEYTQKIKSSFHYWENIFFINDLEVANLIKRLNINILVDLNGYTENHRMGVLIQKPSPIQVTWAGYLASIGISEIDYIIADNFVIPDEKKILYREKVINLSIWAGLYPEESVYLNRTVPALKNKFITFGSFSNLRKINSSVINLWSKILVTLPDSKLVIRCKELKNLELKEYYINLFVKNLVNKNQLIFIGEVSRFKLLEMYNEIDIALDPFPYNGGTTNFEAAWMCIPILTKIGDTFISRCGGSINKTLGLEDWICENEEDYFNKAIKFSKDLNYLQLVKNSLIEQRKKSIIFDGKKLASEIYESFNKLINT
jgi:predicted O-linked N-acetylglucosamine transferase (SPINDLY family)